MIERSTRFPRTNGFLPEVYQEPEKRLQIKPDFFRLFSGFPSFFHLFSTSLSHVAELICHLSLAGKRVKNKLAVLLMYETFLVFLPAGPGDHHVGKHRQINCNYGSLPTVDSERFFSREQAVSAHSSLISRRVHKEE